MHSIAARLTTPISNVSRLSPPLYEKELDVELQTLAQEILSCSGFVRLRLECQPQGGADGSPTLANAGVFRLEFGASVQPLHPPLENLQLCAKISGKVFGCLSLQASICPEQIDRVQAQVELDVLAGHIAALLQRIWVRQQIASTYQSCHYWRGHSKALQSLENRTAKLAQAGLPILLVGGNGVGKLPAAYSLHCQRYFDVSPDLSPFISANCREWQAGTAARHLHALAQRARVGSLYLAQADALRGPDLATLKDFVAANDAQATFIMLGRRQSDNELADGAPDFTQWAEFHCLSLELPPLCARRADIRALGTFFLQQYLQQYKADLVLTDGAWALLENYAWPENGEQLQAVLKKAASLACGTMDQQQIEQQQLEEWFPSLRAASLPAAAMPILAGAEPSPVQIEPLLQNSLQERRVSAFAWFGLQQPENEHPALVRALDFIWNHYQQALALADVANKACISASHLSYLFKLRLQRSFKQIMTEIRIDKAKHIFENMPARQITQVCLDVGFADLSHFEKTFKRMVGLNPRCYRQQFRPALSTHA